MSSFIRYLAKFKYLTFQIRNLIQLSIVVFEKEKCDEPRIHQQTDSQI